MPTYSDPTSDVGTQAWTISSGAVSYEMLNDGTARVPAAPVVGSDYISTTTSGGTAEVQFPAPSPTPNAYGDVNVMVYGAGGTKRRVALVVYEGATQRSWAGTIAAAAAGAWYALPLRSAPSSWSGLSVRFTCASTGSSSATAATIYETYLVVGETSVTGGSETDAAGALSEQKSVTLTPASETDTGAALSYPYKIAAGTASETDTANAVGVTQTPQSKTLTGASESDTANALDKSQTGGTTYAATLAADSVVSYWRLGEPSGTNAADAADSNAGTYYNTPGLGATGLLVNDSDTAVAFTASSLHYVKVTDPGTGSNLDLTTGATLEAIIKPTSITGEHHIINKHHYNLILGGDRIRLEMELNDGATYTTYQAWSASTAIAIGNTYHVAGVYDKTAATMTVYINGVASGTPTSVPAGRNITNDNDVLCIGSSYNTTQYFFDGVIDEPAVYNYALTATQIQNHYTVANTGGGGGTTKTLTAASESDTANAVGTTQAPQSLALTSASETDTASALAKTQAPQSKALAGAAETDTANTVTETQTPQSKTLSPASETDTAGGLSYAGGPQAKTLTVAAESDTAQALAKTQAPQSKALTAGTETDSASTPGVTKTIYKTIAAASESDAAQALSLGAAKTLTAATETDTAQALGFTKAPIVVTLGLVARGSNSFGIAAGGSMQGWSQADVDRELNDYFPLHATWMRHDFQWDVIEPTQGNQTWTGYDQLVTEAVARNINILATITYTPAWANGGQSDNHYEPTDASQFGTFAGQVASRYASQGVHVYEIWNEPNIGFWMPAPDPVQYTACLQAAYAAIKAADPTALVLTGGSSPGGTGGGMYSPQDWLTALYSNGAKPYFDAVSHHPYIDSSSTPGDLGSGWTSMSEYGPLNLRGIMTANGDGAKRIWATEIGCKVDLVPDASERASRINQAFGKWKTYSWAGALCWFTYWDPGSYGMVDGSWVPRPDWYAYQSAAKLASEADTANALSVTHAATLTAATETDTAGSLSVAGGPHLLTATACAETDTAQTLAKTQAPQSKALTVASETDTASVLAKTQAGQSKALTAAGENDTASAPAKTQAPQTPQALTAGTEADATSAVGFTKAAQSATLTVAGETDTANAVSTAGKYGLTAATETDTASAVAKSQAPQSKNLTAASETDTANAVGSTQTPQSKTLTASTETDAAGVVGFTKAAQSQTVTAASEADTASALVKTQAAQSKTLTAAAETDTANVAILLGHKVITASAETDTAQALGITKTIYKALTAASETDASQALSVGKQRSAAAASEADTANAVGFTKTIYTAITAAAETDTAQQLRLPTKVATASETDAAGAVTFWLQGQGPTVETHPNLGGTIDETRTGGRVVAPVLGGDVAVGPRGGDITHTGKTGATIATYARGGTYDQTTTGADTSQTEGGDIDRRDTGGVFDETRTGGGVAGKVRGGRYRMPQGGVVNANSTGGYVDVVIRGGIHDGAETGGDYEKSQTGGDVL